ncbi:M24 family metallopeptidase [Breoghania sp. L-A4]|uniref:M24 family metallopeptidase n=1 Tax=Breoghania sp. L-A4 TaxID=2304600 RepID=UPI000E35B2A1|nr:M24 family metallopeptidase [Breoghania sp. L-A4]AXS42170.1 M24 family metallopeptidase [Breoghania sp. L-A4]
MIPVRDRLVSRISTPELERRWALTRAMMAEHGIDVLVMQNSQEFVGGYVKWFTDIPAKYGVPTTVIFPRDEEMIVIEQGPRGTIRTPQDAGDTWPWRGVQKLLATPYTVDEVTCDTADAALAVAALRALKPARIGWLGLGAMRYSFGAHLREELSAVDFVNAAYALDPIKAVKSPEEMELLRQTAALQDKALEAAFAAAEPGMFEFELVAIARKRAEDLGSTQGLILSGSAPVGIPPVKGPSHFQGRQLREGDQFTILIEVNGPGGLYTELGRTCVLGRASQDMLDEFEIARAAQDHTLANLRPGALPADIWNAHNAFMRANNRPEEGRLFAHAMGYDLVERPALRDDDPMPLAANMCVAVHPTYVTPTTYTWLCDNYFITEDGVSDCLHKTEKKIFEL